MNEFEKQADAIRREQGDRALNYIAANRHDAALQRDPEMIAHWDAIVKAFRQLDK